jgi:serine/threonine-protein kinase
VAVLVLGALSVGGGILGVRFYREWNTHVPKVAGYTIAAAEHALHTSGYAVDDNVTNLFSETVPKGLVIRTDPRTGTRVSQGGSIRLVVSLGKDRVPVPLVAKLSLSAAETALQGRGLEFDPNPRLKASTNVPNGYVISTEPAAGRLVRRTQRITFVVSSGLPQVTVPSIEIGMPYDQAAAVLQKAHVDPSRIDEYSDTVPSGGVISVDGAGERKPWGSSVPVRVSKGPEFVTIPDYTPFEALSDLQPKLEALGLNVNVVKEFGGKAGRIINVDPGAGTQVHPGDTVTVTIV